MPGRRRARTISIMVAAVALSAAVGVAAMLATAGGDVAAPVSDVAGSRIQPPQTWDDDTEFYAGLRAERRAAALALTERKTWYEAVRGPTFEQVLVFFNVLLSSAPHDATLTPPDPPPPLAAFVVGSSPRLAGTGAASSAPTGAPAPTATPPPPGAASSAPTTAPTRSDVWTDAAFTEAVWDGVNARRAQAGVAAVAGEPQLTRAASDYAIAMSMADWFSHTGPDGSSFVDRIVAAGFPFEGQVGEILAMGTNGWPAADVVQAWMDSPPHREQMLMPGYRLAGLDCAFTREDGALTVRCVMEFAA